MCYCHLVNELPKNQEYYIKHPKEFKKIISNGIKNKLIGTILEEDGKTLKIDSPIIYPKTMKKYIEEYYSFLLFILISLLNLNLN